MMRFNMKIFFMTFILFSLSLSQGFAQSRPILYQDEENYTKMTNDQLLEKKDVTLQDDSIIYDLNKDTGVKDKSHYTGRDGYKLSGHYMGNVELNKFTDISAFEFNFSKRFAEIWVETFVGRTAATFKAISENKKSNINALSTSEARYIRPDNSSETLLSAGVGIGYRFKMIYQFIDTTDVFETISAFVTRHILDESFRGTNYNGYGFRADYGIHKRSTTSFFYGAKASYNFGAVKRRLNDGESRSEGTLSLSWLALGFEAGYYF